MKLLRPRKAVARLLGVKPHTMAVWAVNGFGPPVVKIGKQAQYDMDDVVRFIESRKRASTSAEFPNPDREEAA